MHVRFRGAFVNAPYGTAREEQRSSQQFLKATRIIEKVNNTDTIAAQKLLECKAHHSGQDAGDLTIVKSHARSNAVYGNF